ncbi:M-phase inducer phosphatase 1-like isoform X2 [Melanerpes formicivorus]|uniref:M-phase inducer phosphatase 1-like isoform X2 n=1 Tax=Melanerpes formicivorus TaxID=211600 RepID=UPI00358F2AA1
MAALAERLLAEASCSVCLELFSEPVLTECGHSFCRRCLSALLRGPGAACPQCRAPLGPGSLRHNRALGAVAELAAELEAEAGRPRCRRHGEALALFCESCRCPLCPRCWDEPAHRQHPARPAGEAAQRLREVLQRDLVLMQKEREDLKPGGEKQSDVLLSKVALEQQRLRDTFEELQQFLQEQKEALLAQLAQAHQELAEQRSHYVSRASERRSLLDRVIAEIEKKRDQQAAEFLMDVGRTLSSCEAAKVPVPEPVSPELQRQVGNLCELSQLLTATVANFRGKVLSEMDRERVQVTLDPETASPDLVLSEDCRSVRLAEGQQSLPSTPRRFSGSPSVLGRQGFTAGRHYWEVEHHHCPLHPAPRLWEEVGKMHSGELGVHPFLRHRAELASPAVVKSLFPADLSPVSDLRLTMEQLGRSEAADAEQGLEGRSTSGLQRTESSESTDSGCALDSPGPAASNDIMEETFERAILESSRLNLRIPFRRIHSLPQSLLGSSPALKRNHSDSLESDFKLLEQDENKENESFEFKKPTKPAARCPVHVREGKGVPGPRQNSSPAQLLPVGDQENCRAAFLQHSSLPSSESEDDDGFAELLDDQDLKGAEELPSDVSSLWTAPLVMRRAESRAKRCRLFGSAALPAAAGRATQKRMERSQEESSPGKSKKRRSLPGASSEDSTSLKIVKTKSSTAEIESILDSDQRDLIGDFSKGYLFHTVDGKHQDLKYIDSEMVVSVLTGKFASSIKRCLIIDCRYPYEYEGGHIKGAVNLHMEEDVEDYLLKKPIQASGNKRVILVFHCEFSSERGPRMCRFVRERDRLGNEYPRLHYPELYVLKGGYRDFFLRCRSFCEPQGYRPMHHEDFKEDLKRFRTKSRTWAGEKSKRELYSRLKKL